MIAGVVAVLAACLLVGCQPPPVPTVQDVSGTWIHEEPDGQIATITINPDRTIRIDDVPTTLLELVHSFSTDVDWTELTDATGTWEVAGEPTNYFLRLRLDDRAGDWRGIQIEGSGDSTRLSLLSGPTDYDVRITFERQTEPASTPG